jgi:type II secretory pathway pseudopilin PulG
MVAARGRDDLGETLIEVMMSIVILGIALVAIVGGMAASVLSGDIHRKESSATAVLVSAAEALKDPSVQYKACATPSEATYVAVFSAPPVSTTAPAGWAAPVISSIAYWDGSAFGSTCYDTAAYGNILRLQQITITVKSPDNRATEYFSVIKRDDA